MCITIVNREKICDFSYMNTQIMGTVQCMYDQLHTHFIPYLMLTLTGWKNFLKAYSYYVHVINITDRIRRLGLHQGDCTSALLSIQALLFTIIIVT